MSNVSLSEVPNSVMPEVSRIDAGGDAASVSSSDVLKNAINSVNQVNDNAAALVSNLLQGGNGDVNNVMNGCGDQCRRGLRSSGPRSARRNLQHTRLWPRTS